MVLPHGAKGELRKGHQEEKVFEEFLRDSRRQAVIVSSMDTSSRECLMGMSRGGKRFVCLELRESV